MYLESGGPYSESAATAKHRANGGLAAQHSLEDFTTRRTIWWGDFPIVLLVTAEELTAPAWHTACAFCGEKASIDADRKHLSLGVVGWRNSWQQWVLKKNMMR